MDPTARTRGPLAKLHAPPNPEGRNYSVGLGFGDRTFTIGLGVHAMNVSGSALEVDGPPYVSATASLDFTPPSTATRS